VPAEAGPNGPEPDRFNSDDFVIRCEMRSEFIASASVIVHLRSCEQRYPAGPKELRKAREQKPAPYVKLGAQSAAEEYAAPDPWATEGVAPLGDGNLMPARWARRL